MKREEDEEAVDRATKGVEEVALFVGRGLEADEHALVEASSRGVRASAEGEGRIIDV